MAVFRTFRPDEPPDVEVLVNEQWAPGRAAAVERGRRKSLAAQVNWHAKAGVTYIDNFPADRIRPDETEWSVL